jgi:hypothetical protein
MAQLTVLDGAGYRISFSAGKVMRTLESRRRGGPVACSVESDALDIEIVSDGNAYEETETEEEARTRNWKERGWAPWEELRTPEAQFALDSLEEGDEEPVIAWEDFEKMQNRKKYSESMAKQLEEAALKEEEDRTKAAKYEGSLWERRLVFTMTPPRDWPPPGWKVDSKELAFIRGAQTLRSKTFDLKDVDEKDIQPNLEGFRAPRWEMFLKQYDEWRAANKDRLEKEAIEVGWLLLEFQLFT